MNKVTAVEWFVEQLPLRIKNMYADEITKCKQMEKEQQETLYTEEQVRAAMKYASEITNNKMKYMEDYIQSLKQPKQ